MFRLRTAQKKFRNVAFSPSALFQSGDILLWYDPSDLTTMFKDTAGTQPVTADGDSVALMLDKGQWGGKTLEQVLAAQTELVTNGTFDSDTAWTKGVFGTGVAATIADGVGYLPRIDSSNFSHLSQTVTGSSGFYSVSITVGVAAISFRAGTSALGTTYINNVLATGTHTFIFNATAANPVITVNSATNSSTPTVDNISVKEIPGYHRVQATGTSMPKYKTGPNPAAAENSPELVTNGTFSTDTTGWTGFGATLAVVSGEIEVTNSADAAGYTEAAAFTTVSGRSYRITGTARRGTSSSITINVRAAGGAGIVSLTLTGTVNQDFELTFTATSTSSTIWLICNQAVTGRTGYFDNVSVKEIPASAPYIHWLLYDGTDDGHATGTITWGTDEVAICAGAMKSSDASTGVLVEFGPSVSANANSFGFFLPSAASPRVAFASRGATVRFAEVNNAIYAAPLTGVFGGVGEISTDTSTLRLNGSNITENTGDQGAGSAYGNYALNFGRRDNSSLPFNGREYQTVIRSRLLSDAELASLETFIAGKTGIIL